MKILAMILVGISLSGCTSTSWKAGIATDAYDFKTANPVIPKAEFSLGGTF